MRIKKRRQHVDLLERNQDPGRLHDRLKEIGYCGHPLIEVEEFPSSQISEVAPRLMDHQMNMLVRDMFGEYYIRIPLRKSATILCANVLTTDWEAVVPKGELSYILGNPPSGISRTSVS